MSRNCGGVAIAMPRHVDAQPHRTFVEGGSWIGGNIKPTARRVLRREALKAGQCVAVSANGQTNSMPSVSRLSVFGFFVGQQLP
jgi:hypothetical protein